MRGSLRLIRTTVCNSAEYQRSLVITIGLALPIAPAGIVCVVRVPSACTPLIVCVPSETVVTLFRLPGGPCPAEGATSDALDDGFRPCLPPRKYGVWRAVFRSGSRTYCVLATLSVMNTTCGAVCPDVAQGPTAGSVMSRRVRPSLSRANVPVVLR